MSPHCINIFFLCATNTLQLLLFFFSWKVFKIEGFRPGIPIIRSEGESVSSLGPDSYPLLALEEDPQVRVLQEHQEDGEKLRLIRRVPNYFF